jgi:long-chain acyl-CoA synthetase
MQAVSFVLSEKKIACIFPEGRRSIDENIAEFKKGVGILIKELGVPVIPVYIQGSHQSWPRGNLLPRLYPLKVTFGKPILAAELLRNKEQGQSLDDYEAIAQALREEVLKLVC